MSAFKEAQQQKRPGQGAGCNRRPQGCLRYGKSKLHFRLLLHYLNVGLIGVTRQTSRTGLITTDRRTFYDPFFSCSGSFHGSTSNQSRLEKTDASTSNAPRTR
ncbi:MAG: hypothetical protein BWY09_02882 [Candidatus Hydrogenedentes bacterium ADurb.Bin179]|nr:MAG: hypothetical protein BWY09_02882 [Candidatus Hydrogenedentes bacterium ADurb.Bin179]